MSCELRANILAGCIYRTSYELQVSFLHELRVTFCMQVMSYCLLYYLRVKRRFRVIRIYSGQRKNLFSTL